MLPRPSGGTLPGSSLRVSAGGFRAPREVTFSKAIISGMPNLFSKLMDFRKRT